ncbi:MAG: hypothetical protein JF625_09235 [Inquilinus limosus]|uniref:Beta-lactamase hydrolase-like protein phosphatase-like domain-containing protein n=1 Tax=Inquilinus limosus TaxID=171674 RepID=A0A952FJ45_9PROT|nr:hypothetical protein [Inquilinus limosus]
MAKLTEIAPGLFAAAQVDRAAIAEIAASGAKTLINNRPDGEEPSQLPAEQARAEAERGRGDAGELVAEAAEKGFQIASLPDLVARLRQG